MSMENYKTVSDFDFFYRSIHVDLLKISRTEKPYKGFDKIFINYEHFKCCLQESGVTALTLEKDRLNCMQGLIECFKDVQKRRCSFDYRKYLRNDFTLGCLIVGFVLTCYAIIETIIFFYTSHTETNQLIRQRRIRQQRRYNDFRWDEIFQ